MEECTRENKREIVEKLLAAGGEARRSLHIAISEGHEGIVRLFVDNGVELKGPQSLCDGDNTPLHTAVLSGQSGVVKMLLARGVEINEFDGSSRTPLYLAVQQRLFEIVGALLSAGADRFSQCDSLMSNVVHAAARTGKPTMVDTILAGLEASAQKLLVNMPDSKGYTALHLTAMSGKKQTTRALLRNGANIDALTDGGRTPLHLAVRNLSFEVVRVLISKGADVNIRSRTGETPLHIIARKTGMAGTHQLSVRITDALLVAGADEKILDNKGASPLDVIGTGKGNEDVAEIL